MPAAPQPVDLSGFRDDEDAFEQAKAVAQPVIELLRPYIGDLSEEGRCAGRPVRPGPPWLATPSSWSLIWAPMDGVSCVSCVSCVS